MITIKSANLHNLKNVDIEIPEKTFTVVTGVSGSGKSTAIFDILYEGGKQAYLEAIGLAPVIEREHRYESIEGLTPAIAVTQKTVAETNPRSVVGTKSGVLDLIRDIYSFWGEVACSKCGCTCVTADSCLEASTADTVLQKASNKLVCPNCSSIEMRPGPFSFSFNSVHGMCLHCTGRGYLDEISIDKIIGDGDTTLSGICRKVGVNLHKERFESFLSAFGLTGRSLFSELPEEAQDIFLSGRPGVMKGLLSYLAGRPIYDRLQYTRMYKCTECNGERLRPEAVRVTLEGKTISQLCEMSIKEIRELLVGWVAKIERQSVQESDDQAHRDSRFSEGMDRETQGKRTEAACEGQRVIPSVRNASSVNLNTAKVILQRLKQFEDTGLSHLSLYRPMPTLSGGEAQRLFLASHLESEMGSVIYIFDEPTSGLHESEKKALIDKLIALRDNDNTVIAIEHDKGTIASAEHVIDFGPLGGEKGGEIVVKGSVRALMDSESSITGAYLRGARSIPVRQRRNLVEGGAKSAQILRLCGVSTHNLKNIEVEIPLGMIVGIAGMSGSGKSSLIGDTLIPALYDRFGRFTAEAEISEEEQPEEAAFSEAVYSSISGFEYISGFSEVYQKPIGRNRRSIPLTYAGIWDDIRGLFARQPEAKKNGLKAGHFSFNSIGACKGCRGMGNIDRYLGELGYVTVGCPDCEGDRYSDEVLKVKYKGKTVKDVLNMSIEDAAELFNEEPKIAYMLRTLVKTGLSYLRCGQTVSTLSGGEAQRIKLAEELGNQRKGNILYILDEPTTGLSFHDTALLLGLLEDLCSKGNSIIVIEHDLDVLKFCDYIIELGPGGGDNGGIVVAAGTPEDLKQHAHSIIGQYF